MTLKIAPLKTKSLAGQIAEQIRQSILDGRLKADDRLPTEEELAARFNVSRPTIREALKRLAAQNLVRSRRGPTGGTFITRPSLDDMADTLTLTTMLMVGMGGLDLGMVAQARHQLERSCGELALTHRSDDQLAQMADEIALQENPDTSDEEFCASDVRFHRTLVNATGNPILQLVMFSVIEALQPVTNMVINRSRDRRTIISLHKRILDALKGRDRTALLAALDAQMNYLQAQYHQAQTHDKSGKRTTS